MNACLAIVWWVSIATMMIVASSRADDWVIAPMGQKGRVARAVAASQAWVIGTNEKTGRSFRSAERRDAVDIGDLDGDATYARAVDSDGRVVGDADVHYGSYLHAFIWSRRTGMIDLGTLGGDSSQAAAIDDGIVAGTSTTPQQNWHAFRWTEESGLIDLGTLGGPTSEASAVDNGQIVGTAARTDGELHAFSWTADGGMIDLGDLGGDYSSASAVSDGRVVGLSLTARGDMRAFSWTTEEGMIDLGTLPGGTYSWAVAVSKGRIVGRGDVLTPARVDHAFSWTAETGMVDLGVLPGDLNSYAFDVDDGRVVGYSETGVADQQRAFIWTEVDGMVNLGSLDDRNSMASAVSGDQIAGAVWDDSGSQGVIWTRAEDRSSSASSGDGCRVTDMNNRQGLLPVALSLLVLTTFRVVGLFRRIRRATFGSQPNKALQPTRAYGPRR